MPTRSTLFVVVLVAALAVPAQAAGPDGVYRGQAKSLESDFRYGKVTVRVRSRNVRKLEIEAVTTTGCGGFMTVVFAPDDPETKIVSGSARIKADGRFFVRYRPVESIEDQATTIRARFGGGRVSGTFKSGGLCVNAGRFTAKR